MNTLGQEGLFADILRRTQEAQYLADRDTPIVYCPTCKADTLPVNGVCLWCDERLIGEDS